VADLVGSGNWAVHLRCVASQRHSPGLAQHSRVVEAGDRELTQVCRQHGSAAEGAGVAGRLLRAHKLVQVGLGRLHLDRKHEHVASAFIERDVGKVPGDDGRVRQHLAHRPAPRPELRQQRVDRGVEGLLSGPEPRGPRLADGAQERVHGL